MGQLQTWATIQVTLARPPRERSALAETADRLEELGAMLAAHPDVSGVETRDPSTVGAPSWPELWIYTSPDALDEVSWKAATKAEALALAVVLRTRLHDDDSWRDAWKQFHRAMRVGGDQLLVRPSWIARKPDDPVVEIVLDPGRAFGTGSHASTWLCLEHLCRLVRRDGPGPARVLDLGCGSGILTLAAIRLWPARALAIDIDAEATATTAENLAINGAGDRVRVVTGDVDAAASEGPFDLVLANIRPPVLIPAAPVLARLLAPGGHVVLAGILDEEASPVQTAYRSAGLTMAEIHHQDGWCLLDLVRSKP